MKQQPFIKYSLQMPSEFLVGNIILREFRSELNTASHITAYENKRLCTYLVCVILNAPMTWLRGPRSIWDSKSFSSIPISTRASLVLASTSDNSSEAVVEAAEDLWGSRLKLLSASGQSALQSHLLSRIYKIGREIESTMGQNIFGRGIFFQYN